MSGVPRSNDLGSRLERLERAVGELQRQSTLTSASIGSGGLTVRDNGSIRGLGTGLFDWNGDMIIGGDTYFGGEVTYGPGNRPTLVDANVNSVANFQATNNGTVVSLTIPWPAGYSTVVVTSQVNGFYLANDTVPNSDLPGFYVRINGNESPPMARNRDNFSTFWIVGGHVRKFTGSGSVIVQVITKTGVNLSPAYPENRMFLGATAVFIE